MKFDVPPVVINKLFEQGYENQIVDIVMACENNATLEVSDIPISPTVMEDSDEQIIICPNVYETYTKLVQRINNTDTAQEIPFFLLGNRKNVDGVSCVVIDDIKYDIDKSLSESHVSIDINEFQQMLNDKSHSVISIGHTHGNVAEEKKNSTLARILPEDIKCKYDIRDTGLNISLADIWQHETFKQIAKQSSTKEIMQTIIMYNGDMVMISENGVVKSNNIQSILSDGSNIIIPSGLDEQKMNKQMR